MTVTVKSKVQRREDLFLAVPADSDFLPVLVVHQPLQYNVITLIRSMRSRLMRFHRVAP